MSFKVTLGFAGPVPQPDPNDPNADKDPIIARRIESTVTPIAGGESVVDVHDHPLSEPTCVLTGIPESSRVKIGACYVNADGVASAEFTYLPEFDVIDSSGPVNLTEDITVTTEEEAPPA